MEFLSLIQELNQGKQLANQLRTHLHPSSSSHGILLIDKILRSYENALLALSGGAAASVNSAIAPVNAAVQDGDVSKKRYWVWFLFFFLLIGWLLWGLFDFEGVFWLGFWGFVER